MDLRTEIRSIIEHEKGRPGELLLDLERLNPDKADEFWDEIKRLGCFGEGKYRKISLATLTFANRSLSNDELDGLIDAIGDKYDKNSDILPYIMLMIKNNNRNDKLSFCKDVLIWSEKARNTHVYLNSKRCLDTLVEPSD